MNQNTCKKWEFEGLEFKKGSFHYETSKPYRLWYEYLRLSPIYLLAHKQRTTKGGLTEEQKKLLPSDFNEVLKTYDAFGDIYKYPFRAWWVWHGAKLFGIPKSKLSAAPFAYVAEGHDINVEAFTEFLNSRDAYRKKYYKNDPSYMLLYVPLNGSRADIVKAVNSAIKDEYLQESTPIYSLYGERFHHDTLSTGLKLLWMKAEEPDLTLWRLGKKAGVSSLEKYKKLDIKCEKLTSKMREITPELSTLTSRTLRNAIFVMENAARGKFPCKNKIAYTELNYRYMWQCIRRRQEANLRYLKDTLKGVKEGKTPPVGIMADWDEDLMEIDANYKNKREKQKKCHIEKFISEQLNLHKRRKIE